MPNWCENKLVLVDATKEMIDSICSFEGPLKPHIDFETIVPVPDDPAYRDEPSQAEAKDSPNWWYTWNLKNWGTKWNACDTHINHDTITFETAWSPPIPIIGALSEMFPDTVIGLEYHEPGMEFSGQLIMRGGEILLESTWKYHPDIHTAIEYLI